jgi:hypothetical protein
MVFFKGFVAKANIGFLDTLLQPKFREIKRWTLDSKIVTHLLILSKQNLLKILPDIIG